MVFFTLPAIGLVIKVQAEIIEIYLFINKLFIVYFLASGLWNPVHPGFYKK